MNDSRKKGWKGDHQRQKTCRKWLNYGTRRPRLGALQFTPSNIRRAHTTLQRDAFRKLLMKKEIDDACPSGSLELFLKIKFSQVRPVKHLDVKEQQDLLFCSFDGTFVVLVREKETVDWRYLSLKKTNLSCAIGGTENLLRGRRENGVRWSHLGN